MIADVIHKVAQIEGNQNESKYHPRPSLADPEKCIRQLDYFRQGYEKTPLPGRTYIVFDDGNWHEELTIEWINKTAFKLHSQQMKIESHGLNGSIDGILTDILGVDRLFEHKAINHFTFERFWSGTLPLGYFTQMAIYLDGLQQDNPDIQEGILLIKNKNTGQYLEFLVHYADDTAIVTKCTHSAEGETKELFVYMPGIVSRAVQRFEEIEQYAREGKLHDRPYFLGEDWQCDYCQYAETCWDGYIAEVDHRSEKGVIEGDIAHVCHERVGVAELEKEFKKNKENLNHTIKEWLRDHNYKKAVGDGFSVTLNVKEKAGKQSETLYVRRVK